MSARLYRKLIQIMVPSLLISFMIGAVFYQARFISDSTLLTENRSLILPSNSPLINEIPTMNLEANQDINSPDNPWDSIGGDPHLPETLDIGKLLSDNVGDYQKVWEPWITKAGIHDIEVSPDGEFLAVGGGYLYDNELHVYRWNDIIGKYVRAWESGDGLFNGDIRAVALGDTDNNLFLEMAGACSDGYVHVFEQTHIFDPNTRTETRFDPVWASPYLGSAWEVEISDMDLDLVPDLVVGSWDGNLRWFEYTDHSGYPYSPDHWIDYEEKFRLPLEGHIQSAAVGDINDNGLPDLVVGTQEGYLYIVENDGTVIGGFSIPQDNQHRVIWEAKDVLWSPIMKLDAGQLDSDAATEAVVVARGQGVYTLDYDSTLEDFILTKMVRPLESWETPKNALGEDLGFPLDHWIDAMLSPSTGNVAYSNATGTYPEPIGAPDFCYPTTGYNTRIAQKDDNEMTTFDASSGGIASAILDFGKDEEATGDARPGIPTALTGYDLEIICDTAPSLDSINLSISRDGEEWEPLPSAALKTSGTTLLVDIDEALAARQWLYTRYLNITVYSGAIILIDAIKTKLVNKQLDSACSAIIGQANIEWDNPDEENKIIVGTVEGRILVYRYNSSAGNTTLLFDSYTDERYVLGGSVWDIAQIPGGQRTTYPTWIAGDNNELFNLKPGIPNIDELESISAVPISTADDIVITQSGSISFPGDNAIRLWYKSGSVYLENANAPTFAVVNNFAHYIINGIPPYYTGSPYDQISSAFSQTKYQGLPEYMAIAFFDADNPYDPSNPTSEAQAFITVYRYNSIASYYDWTGYFLGPSLWWPSNEITGQLDSALKLSQIQPTMAWGDMDGDGNEDLIIANGKLYLLRNLGGASWELVPDYFAEINRKRHLYRNPQLVDFDLDGDLDLIMSEKDNSLPGLFYYVNTGSRAAPSWEFRRQDLINLRVEGTGDVKNSTFLRYDNYTLFTIRHGESLNETVGMVALNNFTMNICGFRADYESQNSFIAGINPYLSRVDMNLRPPSISTTEDKNYGYRILKTWDTGYELEQWTQAITAVDLDSDGKRELIVGDFDNNIYVFEHLANNTYKRAYRSFDLSRQINTTESPYAAEQLAGVSASFIRFEWQHVDVVVGGMDIDGDGLQEFAAVSGLTIYLFEHTGRDDSYQLIWSINLADTAWSAVFDYLGIEKFSAITPSFDINYNGNDELMVAAGPFLFIFEGGENNDISEIFMNPSLENMFSIGSKYILPENGLIHYLTSYDGSFELEITQLYSGDFIKDTPEKEILVVGINRTIWGHEHGFGMIMRHNGVSFLHISDFPHEATWLNPIYDCLVDDQDYDGQPEIILGHAHGVDIWEVRLNQSTGPSGDPKARFSLARQSTLSGSLNYPNTQPSNALFEPLNKIPVTGDTELIVLHQAIGNSRDANYLPQGTLVQVFCGSSDDNAQKLQWAYSSDNGTTWNYRGFLFPYWSWRINDSDPSLFQDQRGRLWLTWVYVYQNWYPPYDLRNTVRLAGFIPSYKNPWYVSGVIAEGTLDGGPPNPYNSPSIFLYPKDPEDSGMLAFSVLDEANQQVKARYLNLTKGMWLSSEIIFDGTSAGFSMSSCDVTYQDRGPGNNTVVLAFAGKKTDEVRLDDDIWVMIASWNQTYNWSEPNRISADSATESNPELSHLRSADGTTMLAFEIKGAIMACYSSLGGLLWSEPEELLSLPDFIVYRYFPVLGLSLATWKQNSNVIFSGMETRSPTIAALPFGGFAYSYAMSFNAYLLEKHPLDPGTVSGVVSQYATDAAYQYQLVPIVSPSTITAYYNSLSNEKASYPTTIGYFLLQTVAQSLFSVPTNITNSFPPTSSGFLATYFPDPTEGLFNSWVDGVYYNILTRVNFAMDWQRFSFLNARNIDTGDTDGDGRREIVISSDTKVYMAEIDQSLPDSLKYHQTWRSADLGPITDLAIYDANGNGFEEVFISARGGSVYAFEIIDIELPRALLQFANSRQIDDRSWAPWSERRYHPVLASFDADGDDLNELILSEWGSQSSNLTIFPGSSITNASLPIKKRLMGNLTAMAYQDVNDDGFADLAYGTDQGEYGVIDVSISLAFGSIIFAYPNQSISEPIQSVEFGFRSSDTLWTLLLVGSTQAILAPAWGISPFWTATAADFNGNSLIGGGFGTFGVSATGPLDVAILDEFGNIYLLDIGDGSVVETIAKYSNSSPQDIVFSITDLNEDGLSDLLLGVNNQYLLAMDGASRSTSFNRTDFQNGEIFRQILSADFDGDGYSDILLASDSSFTNTTDWTSYSSFEMGTDGTIISTLPNLIMSGTQIMGDGTLTNIPGDYYSQATINIISPVNTTYLNTTQQISRIWLNYTFTTTYPPTNLELWINDTLQPHVPPPGSQVDFSGGTYNLTMAIKDGYNRTAKDSAYFTVDAAPSSLKATILSPANSTTYYTRNATTLATEILLLYDYFTPSPNVITGVIISIDGQENSTAIESGSYISLNTGAHTINVTVQDNSPGIATCIVSNVVVAVPAGVPPTGKAIITPSEGTRCLASTGTSAQFQFQTPVKRVSFYLTASGSAGVQIDLSFMDGSHKLVNFTEDTYGQFCDYDATLLGFAAIGSFTILGSSPLAWYIDEITYDTLQPQSMVRRFTNLGELSWEYIPPVDQIQWLEIQSSDGLVPQVALVGLASVRDPAFANDPRGLVALDLSTGLPTFHSGVLENAHSGILGMMHDQLTPFLVDGVFVTELGALYEFHLLDRLANQTLPDVNVSIDPNWHFRFPTSVRFAGTADFDLDGHNDVIAATSDGIVAALSGFDAQIIWKTRVNENPLAMKLGNFTGNEVLDIFLASEGGSLLVINGASGSVAWKRYQSSRNFEAAVNLADRGSDGYDDLAVGAKIQGGVVTLGDIYILNGTTGSTISHTSCPGPAIQMTLIGLTKPDTLDGLAVNFLNGVRIYNISAISSLEVYNDISGEFLDFLVIDGELIGVTTPGDLVYYDALNLASPTWTHSFAGDTGYPTNLAYSIGAFDRNGTNAVVVGLVGIGILSYRLNTSGPIGPDWFFRDATARVITNQFSLANCSEDSTYDILAKSAETAYVLDGVSGSLLWRTATSAISSDISFMLVAVFNETQGNEILVGTQGGNLLKFDFNRSIPLFTDPIFVPWYYRYQNHPITPFASISQESATEGSIRLLSVAGESYFSHSNPIKKERLLLWGTNAIIFFRRR